MESPGVRFAEALAAKDWEGVRALLDPNVDFRAMTPRQFWEAGDPETVVADVLKDWFSDSDHIDRLLESAEKAVQNRTHLFYRLQVTAEDTPHIVEQHAYYETDDGRIRWMRVMCSGWLPLNE